MSEIVGTLVQKRAHKIRTHRIGVCSLQIRVQYLSSGVNFLIDPWRGKFFILELCPFSQRTNNHFWLSCIAIDFRIILIEFFVALYFNHWFFFNFNFF